MAKIIRHGDFCESVSYRHDFNWKGGTGGGFSFPCDKGGKVFELRHAGMENYRKCLSGEHDVKDMGVSELKHTYWEPALLECDCGYQFELHSSWANDCDKCGREYNGSGQLLASRSQWGEETGECQGDFVNMGEL